MPVYHQFQDLRHPEGGDQEDAGENRGMPGLLPLVLEWRQAHAHGHREVPRSHLRVRQRSPVSDADNRAAPSSDPEHSALNRGESD